MKLVLALLVCLSFNVFADIDKSDATTITEIWAGYQEGVLLFKTTEAHVNPHECTSTYYVVRDGDANLQVILSVLLAAQRSGSKVIVGVNTSECDSSGRISVTRVASLP